MVSDIYEGADENCNNVETPDNFWNGYANDV